MNNKKRSMTRIISIMLIAILSIMLTACGGDNEADKAYKDWANNTLPKMNQADTDYNDKVGQIQPGDVEGAIAITEEYLAVMRPGVEELAAIDMSKLSSGKDEAKSQLEALQAKLAQLEEALVLYQSQLGAAGGDEGNVDEGVVDEGNVDEGVVDESNVEDEGEVTE